MSLIQSNNLSVETIRNYLAYEGRFNFVDGKPLRRAAIMSVAKRVVTEKPELVGATTAQQAEAFFAQYLVPQLDASLAEEVRFMKDAARAMTALSRSDDEAVKAFGEIFLGADINEIGADYQGDMAQWPTISGLAPMLRGLALKAEELMSINYTDELPLGEQVMAKLVSSPEYVSVLAVQKPPADVVALIKAVGAERFSGVYQAAVIEAGRAGPSRPNSGPDLGGGSSPGGNNLG